MPGTTPVSAISLSASAFTLATTSAATTLPSITEAIFLLSLPTCLLGRRPANVMPPEHGPSKEHLRIPHF
jgi:hypothetical protein